MFLKMELEIKFNRNICLGKDHISPGGYEMVMNGKSVQFDFYTSYGYINSEDNSICDFSLEDPDFESFPEFEKIRIKDLENITEITECFVYTGENDESDLEDIEIKSIRFIVPNSKKQVIDIPDKVLSEYNDRLLKERMREKGCFELKLTPTKFKEKIMAQQMTFYSKFLDIPLEDLCGYTKEQLESMIDSTIEQMPDDLLHQFEIELMGGKRDFK